MHVIASMAAISGNPYRNERCFVLWRNKCMPTVVPIAPPITEINQMVLSATRHFRCFALYYRHDEKTNNVYKHHISYHHVSFLKKNDHPREREWPLFSFFIYLSLLLQDPQVVRTQLDRLPPSLLTFCGLLLRPLILNRA